MGTILTGLLSFMTGNESSTGCDNATNSFGRKKLALESHAWNERNAEFVKWFETKDHVQKSMQDAINRSKGDVKSDTVKKSHEMEVIDLDESPPPTPRLKKKKKEVVVVEGGDSEFEPILLD